MCHRNPYAGSSMIRTAQRFIAGAAAVASICMTLSGEVRGQMAIPGKFEVTPVGEAAYSIPLAVPPGVAGMEPRLALSYNSRGGNGLMGMGWTLAGLPSITRCPRTTPQDGVKGAVAYDANDRFCLDGKRLMVVSGTYGMADSSYRTEIESFAKVTAFGSAGSGPQYFVVKTKEGQTLEFGRSVDSRVTVAGISTIRVWALNKIADSVGNTQTIAYALPEPIATSTTEYSTYPQRIDYTSNSVTGLPATNRVEFAYALRTDIISSYRGGYPFKTSVRLSSITTKTNGATVSIYTPTYEAGIGGRSVVTSISMCAAGGQLCAPLTQFGLGSVGGSLSPLPGPTILPVTDTETSVSGGKWFSMDLDGNGITDLVHLTTLSGAYRVWLSNGDGTFAIREFSTTADTNLSDGSWQMLDVNGDGKPDLVHLTTAPGLIQVWISNGDGTFTIAPFTTNQDTVLSNGSWLTIDVDGDGLADLLHLTTNSGEDMRVWKSNGNGTFTISQVNGGGGTQLNQSQWQVLDLNGDGLADLVQIYSDTANCRGGVTHMYFKTRISNGAGGFQVASTGDLGRVWCAVVYLNFFSIQADVNGDGLMDLVLLVNYSDSTRTIFLADPDRANYLDNTVHVLVSAGNGGLARIGPILSPDRPLLDGTWLSLDSDGDGLTDLIHTPANLAYGTYRIWRSQGDGSFAVSTGEQLVDTCSSNCKIMKAGDFLGIGAPGFVRLDGNTVKSAWFLSSQPSNVVTSVADGAGGKTSWSLSPLPAMLRRGSYVKDIPSDNITWTLAAAVPVVETVKSSIVTWERDSALASLDRSTSFTYGSARVERNGRGFLGFNWLQSKDSVTGLSARSYFRQDFPYIGQVATKGTGRDGSWNNLSLTNTVYGCTLLEVGSTCPVAPGNRYFVYPADGSVRSWDLDGTALPGSAFANRNPDSFGNIRESSSYILNPDGQQNVDYRKLVINTYYNDEPNWIIGRLVKSVVQTTGPTVAPPVIPGSGGLPPAAAPAHSPQTTAALMTILQLLLSDD